MARARTPKCSQNIYKSIKPKVTENQIDRVIQIDVVIDVQIGGGGGEGVGESYFHEHELNLFKTWKGIREIINISKKGKTDITSIQTGIKGLLRRPMNSMNTSLPLINK